MGININIIYMNEWSIEGKCRKLYRFQLTSGREIKIWFRVQRSRIRQ